MPDAVYKAREGASVEFFPDAAILVVKYKLILSNILVF